jgi:hypothetical protein
MDRLELPKLLQRTPGRSHTSSDGQKFEVRVDSLNANHSFKYFGKEQGVSVYTLATSAICYGTLWSSAPQSAACRDLTRAIVGCHSQDIAYHADGNVQARRDLLKDLDRAEASVIRVAENLRHACLGLRRSWRACRRAASVKIRT